MDAELRMASFNWLEKQSVLHDEVLPRPLLESGFDYKGKRITLVGPKGIWKPKYMELPLSITTISDGPYDDDFAPDDDLIMYRYRGTDPYHSDNVGLRKLMAKQIPLIYFRNIVKGKYLASWPVFIQNDNIGHLTFSVALEAKEMIFKTQVLGQTHEGQESYGRRSYLTSTIRTRLHQKSFREKVIRAYQNQCALCQLRHAELLDAAHIIPDKEEKGDPVVTNGLSLCKIHHAAFDNNILGISPNYLIKVRTDILEEIDGPMLKHGIQSLNENKMFLPSKEKEWPDQERLEIRYDRFLKAG